MAGIPGARLQREAPDLVRVHGPGGVLAELRAGDLGAEAFETLVETLAAALRSAGPPRVVVTYREGLLGPVCAEAPLDLLFVEEDPHDTPPVQLRRRQVAADPAAVAAAIAATSRTAGAASVQKSHK